MTSHASTHLKVVIVGHSERPEASMVARRAVEWLLAHDHQALACPDDADALGLADVTILDDPTPGADLVLSVGGDGTMLRCVTMLNGAQVPVLGINVGHLGYLAEVEPEQMLTSLERFCAGDYEIEKRLVLDVTGSNQDGSP
ncbi:MAG: NAD(+)/NADH kinase, partial [Ilumatobacteraceae bacterium]|nr:NAD(+)/NADH kinase [Ilumatobacteraceae bacterium]